MASFRLRGLRWQARILRTGSAPVVQSFVTRLDAERWARSVETDMDKGSFVSVSLAQRTTLGEVISRYIAEVLPSMRGAKDDAIRLNWCAVVLAGRAGLQAGPATLPHCPLVRFDVAVHRAQMMRPPARLRR